MEFATNNRLPDEVKILEIRRNLEDFCYFAALIDASPLLGMSAREIAFEGPRRAR